MVFPDTFHQSLVSEYILLNSHKNNMTVRYTEWNITNIASLVDLLYVTFTLNMLLKRNVNNTEQQHQSVLQGEEEVSTVNHSYGTKPLDLLRCAHML